MCLAFCSHSVVKPWLPNINTLNSRSIYLSPAICLVCPLEASSSISPDGHLCWRSIRSFVSVHLFSVRQVLIYSFNQKKDTSTKLRISQRQEIRRFMKWFSSQFSTCALELDRTRCDEGDIALSSTWPGPFSCISCPFWRTFAQPPWSPAKKHHFHNTNSTMFPLY